MVGGGGCNLRQSGQTGSTEKVILRNDLKQVRHGNTGERAVQAEGIACAKASGRSMCGESEEPQRDFVREERWATYHASHLVLPGVSQDTLLQDAVGKPTIAERYGAWPEESEMTVD